MKNLLRETLENLLTLTADAEVSCLQEDWETLERLQTERMACLTQLNAGLKQSPLTEADQSYLQQILLDNQSAEQRMVKTVSLHRQQLLAENEQLQKGEQMAKAYKT